jgi:hypothetical protein
VNHPARKPRRARKRVANQLCLALRWAGAAVKEFREFHEKLTIPFD